MFAPIVDCDLFCSNNEPYWPTQFGTKNMCMKNRHTSTMCNLFPTNLQWHFTVKKIKIKHKDRLIGEVQTKTICVLIQKVETKTTTTINTL